MRRRHCLNIRHIRPHWILRPLKSTPPTSALPQHSEARAPESFSDYTATLIEPGARPDSSHRMSLFKRHIKPKPTDAPLLQTTEQAGKLTFIRQKAACADSSRASETLRARQYKHKLSEKDRRDRMRVALSQLELLLSIPCCEESQAFLDITRDGDSVGTRLKPGPSGKVHVITSAVEYILCMQRRLQEVQRGLISRGET